ncbi:hypothetical protein [Desulfobacula sp.]|uniref:hypothetical protein n=1 Tax=Desulfobacula sp. TaxID=2593537 RepID=UPI002630549B|nr:hypothetical protein [Desulfobacula sp.]
MPEKANGDRYLDWEQKQFDNIRKNFSKKITPFFGDITGLRVANRLSHPRNVPGEIESEILPRLFHYVIQTVVATHKFVSTNRNPVLVNMSTKMAKGVFLNLAMDKVLSERTRSSITWARKQYGGIAGVLPEGTVLGKGQKEINIAINALAGVDHINADSASVMSAICATEKDGLRKIPDEVLFNGCIIRESFDPLPVYDDLKLDRYFIRSFARELNKQPDEIKVIIPSRECHISHKDDPRKRLLDILKEQGIIVKTRDHKRIFKEVNENGYFENGNVLIVSDMFMAIFKLMEGGAHLLVGADRSISYAQISFVIKAFGKGEAKFRFVSRERLRDRRNNRQKWPDLYGENSPTMIDRGEMRRYGIVADDVDVSGESEFMKWSEQFTDKVLVPGCDGGMWVVAVKNCNFWLKGMDAPEFKDDYSSVTLSVLHIGLSGDIKVLKVTCSTTLSFSSHEVSKRMPGYIQEKQFFFAKALIEFGAFNDAQKQLQDAGRNLELKDHPPSQLVKTKKLFHIYEIYRNLLRMLTKEDYNLQALGRKTSDVNQQNFLLSVYMETQLGLVGNLDDRMFNYIVKSVPELALIMRTLYQYLGNSCRWEGQEEFKSGNDDFDISMVAALENYKKSLKCYPAEELRNPRERDYYNLYENYIQLCGHFLKYSDLPDHYSDRQLYFKELYQIYIECAKAHLALNFKGGEIYFSKRAFEVITGSTENYIIGVYPLVARLEMLKSYEREGWFEEARSEYRKYANIDLLCAIIAGGDTSQMQNLKFIAESYWPQFIIGYLTMNYFAGIAINPSLILKQKHMKYLEAVKDWIKENFENIRIKRGIIYGTNVRISRIETLGYLNSDQDEMIGRRMETSKKSRTRSLIPR